MLTNERLEMAACGIAFVWRCLVGMLPEAMHDTLALLVVQDACTSLMCSGSPGQWWQRQLQQVRGWCRCGTAQLQRRKATER